MPDLDIVTHVNVEKAMPDGYHYLHETAMAWHHGALYIGWANHRTREMNVKDELLRGRRSTDGGYTWGPVQTWVTPAPGGTESYNHPAIASHADQLWGFFTHWQNENPNTEIFTLDEASGQWRNRQASIPGFLPFRPPIKMRDGNWIMGGEYNWYEAGVAISHGDDFTRWDTVRIPQPPGLKLMYPETALIDVGGRLTAILRPHGTKTAPISTSNDLGRTWTPLQFSNFPLAESQPYSGQLSTGQQYLITNNLEQGRWLLSIAVTRPGGSQFCRIWKIRHQQHPKRRLFGGYGENASSMVGQPTEWSYPAAIEHEGKLYVSYTQGKEDCVLSIIPVSVLRA